MNIDTRTPNLRVSDPRALLVRDISYCRSEGAGIADERVTRHMWNLSGHPGADWDPRLWANALPPHSTFTHTLAGTCILDTSTDAGWRLHLPGADAQTLESWDARGSYHRTDHDECLRLIQITAHSSESESKIVERLTYGDASHESSRGNLCGQLVRHDDSAGTSTFVEYSLGADTMVERRQFLSELHAPDWPADMTQRDALHEPVEAFVTSTRFDATSSITGQTDAVGNQRWYSQTICGLPKEIRLQLAGRDSVQSVLAEARYNAEDQIEIERLGNGVKTLHVYEPETGRRVRIRTQRSDAAVLQDLNYQFDPVGNAIEIEDRAQPVRFFANQKTEPVSRYTYDSLYQLIGATGREVSNGASHGPALPDLGSLPLNPEQLSNYTQTFRYDEGGNLLQMRHVGAHSFTRNMLIAPNSNRSLSADDSDADFEKGFDANGNLQRLMRRQLLSWNPDNQLTRVTAVQHQDGSEDDEVYVYSGSALRCRKIRHTLAKNRRLIAEVRYLPGLEIRSEPGGELLHIASIQVGHSHVRVLHWRAGKPEGIANDQIRFSIADVLNSSTLELDHASALLSQENYYSFGGTAYWVARNAIEAKYKTVRYSGKERDATGLYYYGLRYYAPWLSRWINPDPKGTADGLNQFAFVMNNPINRMDLTGGEGMTPDQAARIITHAIRMKSYKNNAFREARTMYDEGTFFTGFRERNAGRAPESLEGLMKKNISNLRRSLKTLTDDEKQFYQGYQTTEFHLTHATDNPDILDQQQRLTLRSRSWLEANDIPVTGHSFDKDLTEFQNFGYVFFALETGQNLIERKNQYGKTVFRVPFDEDFKSSHMVLVDQLEPETRSAFPLELSEFGEFILENRDLARLRPAHMFAGTQAKDALALSIILQARQLPKEDRTKILAMSTPDEIHLLTNTLFKPEIRFPRHFTTQKAKRYNT
ncbi:RHS repeat-associated core domain-containing protein [Pseudomonas sp. RC10]|uniref:RHS repeat domain-containing protein n=1 Tax=Pseudomonas bambusae TaxID=3139142 RepID=UPI00313A2530